MEDRFWETRCLEEMSPAQWEALCDGCGRCCLQKVEDPEDHAVFYTAVACRFLDIHSCCCTAYARRTKAAPDCLVLTPRTGGQYHWLPRTCAYRLLAEGNELPSWHPLISGSRESVHAAGISLRDKAISEQYVHPDDLDAYILEIDF